jgi:transposase
MVDHRAVAVLVLQGRSYRQVVAEAGCSHRDVSRVRKVIAERGVTAQKLSAMGADELAALFPDGRGRVSDGYDAPDFALVAESMRRNRHYTVSQAWRAYTESASLLRKYGYTQYCHLFAQYARTNDLVAVLHHEPGRLMLVDWAGDTVPLEDPVTGEKGKAYLFVAVLPFSGMFFCRAYSDMKMEAWLDGRMAAFEEFAGVPRIVVPDNAATATHRKAKGDPARFVSDRYQQMADHYGCAVAPARVNRPRDKAAAESGVNTANKRVLGYVLEHVWATTAELNDAIAERIAEVNRDIRRKDGTTRFELFSAEEAGELGPPPRTGSRKSTGGRPKRREIITSPATTSTTPWIGGWPGSWSGSG